MAPVEGSLFILRASMDPHAFGSAILMQPLAVKLHSSRCHRRCRQLCHRDRYGGYGGVVPKGLGRMEVVHRIGKKGGRDTSKIRRKRGNTAQEIFCMPLREMLLCSVPVYPVFRDAPCCLPRPVAANFHNVFLAFRPSLWHVERLMVRMAFCCARIVNLSTELPPGLGGHINYQIGRHAAVAPLLFLLLPH